MMNALWLVGMFLASQWGPGVPLNNTEKGLLGRAAGTSARNAGTDRRIVTCWDDRIQVCKDSANLGDKLSILKGSVYLYCGDSKKLVCANGTIHIDACDRAGRKLAQWQFDAASLEKLKRTDLIGVGYTLCLPLDRQCLETKDMQLKLTYRGNDGKSCCDEPTRLTLRCDAPAVVVQAAHKEPQVVYSTSSEAGRGVQPKQVQFQVLMAHVDPAAVKHLKFDRPNDFASSAVSIVKNGDGLIASLHTLRSQGLAKILAEPNIVTLSGRPATFQSGGEAPVLVQTSHGREMTFKHVGISLGLLPIVMAHDKIHLEVSPELSMMEKGTNNYSIRSARMLVQMNDGQTLVIVNPGLPNEKGDKQDLVLIVTPHLIQSADAKASQPLTFTEIVTLSNRGISDDIIIRQMELTGAMYQLTTEQILSLHDQGISNAVIRAMQERRPTSPTPVKIAPSQIQGAVGPASSGI